MNTASIRFAGLVACSLAALSTPAATLRITGTTAGGGLLQLSGFRTGTYYAGPFSASIDGSPETPLYNADLLNFASYSVDTSVTVEDTATKGGGYAHAAQIYNKYALAASTSATLNAALQGAIWKSIYGNSLGLTDGTPGAAALALSYFGEDLSAFSTHASFYNAGGANTAMLGAAPVPVPEPASFAALGLGVAAFLRRRKKA